MAKNILAPLGITAVASAIGAGIQKKIHGSGTTTLIILNEEINEIRKLFKFLKTWIDCWNKLLKELKMKQENKKESF